MFTEERQLLAVAIKKVIHRPVLLIPLFVSSLPFYLTLRWFIDGPTVEFKGLMDALPWLVVAVLIVCTVSCLSSSMLLEILKTEDDAA
jgi:hypothetical protein